MKELKRVVFSKCARKEWDETPKKCSNLKFETHKKKRRRVYEKQGTRVREKYYSIYSNLIDFKSKVMYVVWK